MQSLKGTLNKTFDYVDGGLHWKIKHSKGVNVGQKAGCYSTFHNRRSIRLNGVLYKEYNLIWIYHNGDIPIGLEVDHIDRNPMNNRIENLRLGTHAQNGYNLSISKKNTSGYKGVSFNRKKQLWEVSIFLNYKRIALGFFSDKNDAGKAYNEAAKKHYGEFANLNVIL